VAEKHTGRIIRNDYLLKERYYLEPSNLLSGWVLRKEGSNSVIKKAKYKMMLLYFAESLLGSKRAELRVCDSNGLLEEVIDFESVRPAE
jgi:hypothetical protein